MKPKRVKVWACSSCGNGHVHTTKKSAAECCICPGCKTPYTTAGGGRVYCSTCTSDSELEQARKALESAANNFIYARDKRAMQEKVLELRQLRTNER